MLYNQPNYIKCIGFSISFFKAYTNQHKGKAALYG